MAVTGMPSEVARSVGRAAVGRTWALVVGVGVVVAATPVRADIAPPPFEVRVGSVRVEREESSAPPAEVERTARAVRAALARGLRSIRACVEGSGGLARDFRARHARLRATWVGGAMPSEVRVVSSSFDAAADACFADALRAVMVVPSPTGRVVMAVRFDRDDDVWR